MVPANEFVHYVGCKGIILNIKRRNLDIILLNLGINFVNPEQ